MCTTCVACWSLSPLTAEIFTNYGRKSRNTECLATKYANGEVGCFGIHRFVFLRTSIWSFVLWTAIVKYVRSYASATVVCSGREAVTGFYSIVSNEERALDYARRYGCSWRCFRLSDPNAGALVDWLPSPLNAMRGLPRRNSYWKRTTMSLQIPFFSDGLGCETSWSAQAFVLSHSHGLQKEREREREAYMGWAANWDKCTTDAWWRSLPHKLERL